jgi:hypothetical protein
MFCGLSKFLKDWLRFRSWRLGLGQTVQCRMVGRGRRQVACTQDAGVDCVTAAKQNICRAAALVRYREWYGSSGQPNTGLKLTPTTLLTAS